VFPGKVWVEGFGVGCADDSSLAELSANRSTREFEIVSDGIGFSPHLCVPLVNDRYCGRTLGERVIIYIY
jgi:hypothetical protein